jgi:hypothetical protein
MKPRFFQREAIMNPSGSRILLFILILVLALVFSASHAANSLQRDQDPVVFTGLELPWLLGEDPVLIVAFRFDAGWVQIPLQVDERDMVDFGAPYDTTSFGLTVMMYVDDGTFTGPDSDPAFDLDDELVFMARDVGDAQASVGEPDPPGVEAGTRLELTVGNPLNGLSGFVYLFVSNGSLTPDAGQDYVTYDFVLLSGDYKTTYDLFNGPNPEDSVVATDFFRTHFSDRWIRDEINIRSGAATEVDILDRHKNLFGPGNCGRSEDTFSGGEGCFTANIDGPVRVIRSYLGANSGPFTQRVHLFYERRQDLTTHLRVHAISGLMDYYDYSPAAAGMTYYNDLNTDGIIIDGIPDTPTPGQIIWEMVTGLQGTLVIAQELVTDIPGFAYTLYYSDTLDPPYTQCTGDSYEYGASGTQVDQGIPNTDPGLGPHYIFQARRMVYFEEPDQPVALAQTRNLQARTALTLLEASTVVTGIPSVSLSLEQNVPNPFNGITVIGFRAPAGEFATLRIHDAAGRVVRTLVAGSVPDGAEQVTWDGRDAKGHACPSGVYFCRITAGPYSATKKMTFVQ